MQPPGGACSAAGRSSIGAWLAGRAYGACWVSLAALTTASAGAQIFPDDAAWVSVLDHSCAAPLFDAVGDTASASRDLVSSNEPAVQVWSDGGSLFFRLRVDDDPRAGTDWDNFAWACEINSDFFVDNYEYLVELDGKNSQVAVFGNNVHSQGVHTEHASEPADALLWSEAATAAFSDCSPPWGNANSRDCSDGSGDFFVDFAVPLSAMSLSVSSYFRLICGAVANPSSTPSLVTDPGGDIAGTGSTGDPLWSALSSCQFSLGCASMGCPASKVCLEDGTCADCAIDDDCQALSPDLPRCVDHQCFQCAAATEAIDCSPDTPRCDPSTGGCVECLTNPDCTDPGSPVCLQATQTCVQCFVDEDCPDPGAPLCSATTHACVGVNLFADGFEDGFSFWAYPGPSP